MKYCMHCGTQLKDEDRFCQKCGKPCEVKAPQPQQQQPQPQQPQQPSQSQQSGYQPQYQQPSQTQYQPQPQPQQPSQPQPQPQLPPQYHAPEPVQTMNQGGETTFAATAEAGEVELCSWENPQPKAPQGGYQAPQGGYQQPPQGTYQPPQGGGYQPPQGGYQAPQPQQPPKKKGCLGVLVIGLVVITMLILW